jgi:uncharacterized protein (TIGR04552 family)
VVHPPSLEAARPISVEDLSLEDLETVRLMLRGGSVIDWYQLDFRGLEDVDRFLRINEFDPAGAEDMDRLEELRLDAVEYLTRNFDFRLPDAVASQVPARDLFLIASRQGDHRLWACVILKVMHIIHHLAGRELSTRLSIPADKIYRAIELKVMRVIEDLRAAGYPVVEFQWSRKSLDSLITKLLAKRSTLAANIYDKLRFRMIVRGKDDILPMLAALHRRLIPFNYVVPGESVNHLVDLGRILDASAPLRALGDQMMTDDDGEARPRALLNEFSGEAYQVVNFVADLPVRVDSYLDDATRGHGNVVFVLTEFQLADQATALANEAGDNSHELYKARQHRSVRQRLLRARRAATAGR